MLMLKLSFDDETIRCVPPPPPPPLLINDELADEADEVDIADDAELLGFLTLGRSLAVELSLILAIVVFFWGLSVVI